MSKISACLIVRNEEKRIRGCLESINGIVDEIVVVDGYSEDKTVEICEEYTDKIYEREPKGYMEADLNFALEKANYDWVLLLDADERLSTNLACILKILVEIGEKKSYSSYYIPKEVYIKGKGRLKKFMSGPGAPRFFKKEKSTWAGLIHEKPRIKGNVRRLPRKYHIIHYPSRYHSSYGQVFQKNLRYLKSELEQGRRAHSIHSYLFKAVIAFPREFFRNLIVKGTIFWGLSLGIHRALFKGIYRFILNFFVAFSGRNYREYRKGHWIFKFLAFLFIIEHAMWQLAKSHTVEEKEVGK